MNGLKRIATIAVLSALTISTLTAQSSSSKPGNSQPTTDPQSKAWSLEPEADAAPAEKATPIEEATPTLATRPTQDKVLMPVGTAIRMKLDNRVSTNTSAMGQTFTGKVSEAVVIEGKTIVLVGANLTGHIVRLNSPRRFAGKPTMDLVPDTIYMPDGKKMLISAVIVDTGDPKHLHVNEEGRIKGPGFNSRDKVEMVSATGVGTIVGTVIAPGPGTWMGAAAGATFGGAHWLVRRHSLELPVGTELIMEISNPVLAPVNPAPAVALGGGM